MMSNFIQGIITYNTPSAQENGIVYTRRLGLRTKQGTEIKIFDMAFPLSDEISAQTECTVVLSVLLPSNMRYASPSDGSPLPDGWWQGIIRDVNWSVSDTYTSMRSELAESGWMLIETPVGDVLVGYHSVRELVLAQGMTKVEVGSLIQWEPVRFDLEAISLETK